MSNHSLHYNLLLIPNLVSSAHICEAFCDMLYCLFLLCFLLNYIGKLMFLIENWTEVDQIW